MARRTPAAAIRDVPVRATGRRPKRSPAFPAGATFHYTNIAFGLLGEVVARLTVKPWFEAVRSRVLDPLGMTRTTYLPEQPAAQGYSVHHFAGTLGYVRGVRERHDLNHRIMGPLFPPDDLWQTDPDECCAMRKVEPLARALVGKQAWVTGLRRVEASTRAKAPIVDRYELEPGRFIVKVNPVADWTRGDAWAYLEEHGLPHSPLYDLGYASIGCAPCTRIRLPGEPERAGRWAGLAKWECGIQEREAPPAPG